MAGGDLRTALSTIVSAAQAYSRGFDTIAEQSAKVGVPGSKKLSSFYYSLVGDSNPYARVSGGIGMFTVQYLDQPGSPIAADSDIWFAKTGQGKIPVRTGQTSASPGTTYFTDDGRVFIDQQGYLRVSDPINGPYLMYLPSQNGTQTFAPGVDSGSLTTMSTFNTGAFSSLAQATSYINPKAILPGNSQNGIFNIPTTFVDPLGVERPIQFTFTKTALNPMSLPAGVAANYSCYQLSVTCPQANPQNMTFFDNTNNNNINNIFLYFDQNGLMQNIYDANANGANAINPGNIAFNIQIANNGPGPLPINMNPGTLGQRNGISITGEQWIAQPADKDGLVAGIYDHISINPDGWLQVWFDNGSSIYAGCLRLAQFPNVNGLQEQNRGLYIPSQSSGNYTLFQPGKGGTGTILSGQIESSNIQTTNVMMDAIVQQQYLTTQYRGIASVQKMLSAFDQMVP